MAPLNCAILNDNHICASNVAKRLRRDEVLNDDCRPIEILQLSVPVKNFEIGQLSFNEPPGGPVQAS